MQPLAIAHPGQVRRPPSPAHYPRLTGPPLPLACRWCAPSWRLPALLMARTTGAMATRCVCAARRLTQRCRVPQACSRWPAARCFACRPPRPSCKRSPPTRPGAGVGGRVSHGALPGLHGRLHLRSGGEFPALMGWYLKRCAPARKRERAVVNRGQAAAPRSLSACLLPHWASLLPGANRKRRCLPTLGNPPCPPELPHLHYPTHECSPKPAHLHIPTCACLPKPAHLHILTCTSPQKPAHPPLPTNAALPSATVRRRSAPWWCW